MAPFSKGVIKAENRETLTASLKHLFKKSLLLVQDTVYRIDLAYWCVNNKPILRVVYHGEDQLAIYNTAKAQAKVAALTQPTYV